MSGRRGSRAHELVEVEQLIEHDTCVPGALLRVAGGGPEHQFVELVRNRGYPRAWHGHGVVRVLVGDLHGRFADIGLLAGKHLVGHDAERVDVAAGIRDAPRDEFGGEVGDRAEQGLPGGRVVVDGPGESEVADLDAAVVGQENVLRLEIAMHDSRFVRGGEAREHRLEDVHRLLTGEPAVVLEQVAQSDAGQVFHDQIGHIGILALVVDVDHVRVREPGGRAGLLHEPGLERVVVGEVPVHDLDGDPAFEAQVGREVHGGHATAGDPGAHLIAAVYQTADHGIGRGIAH